MSNPTINIEEELALARRMSSLRKKPLASPEKSRPKSDKKTTRKSMTISSKTEPKRKAETRTPRRATAISKRQLQFSETASDVEGDQKETNDSNKRTMKTVSDQEATRTRKSRRKTSVVSYTEFYLDEEDAFPGNARKKAKIDDDRRKSAREDRRKPEEKDDNIDWLELRSRKVFLSYDGEDEDVIRIGEKHPGSELTSKKTTGKKSKPKAGKVDRNPDSFSLLDKNSQNKSARKTKSEKATGISRKDRREKSTDSSDLLEDDWLELRSPNASQNDVFGKSNKKESRKKFSASPKKVSAHTTDDNIGEQLSEFSLNTTKGKGYVSEMNYEDDDKREWHELRNRKVFQSHEEEREKEKNYALTDTNWPQSKTKNTKKDEGLVSKETIRTEDFEETLRNENWLLPDQTKAKIPKKKNSSSKVLQKSYSDDILEDADLLELRSPVILTSALPTRETTVKNPKTSKKAKESTNAKSITSKIIEVEETIKKQAIKKSPTTFDLDDVLEMSTSIVIQLDEEKGKKETEEQSKRRISKTKKLGQEFGGIQQKKLGHSKETPTKQKNIYLGNTQSLEMRSNKVKSSSKSPKFSKSENLRNHNLSVTSKNLTTNPGKDKAANNKNVTSSKLLVQDNDPYKVTETDDCWLELSDGTVLLSGSQKLSPRESSIAKNMGDEENIQAIGGNSETLLLNTIFKDREIETKKTKQYNPQNLTDNETIKTPPSQSTIEKKNMTEMYDSQHLTVLDKEKELMSSQDHGARDIDEFIENTWKEGIQALLTDPITEDYLINLTSQSTGQTSDQFTLLSEIESQKRSSSISKTSTQENISDMLPEFTLDEAQLEKSSSLNSSVGYSSKLNKKTGLESYFSENTEDLETVTEEAVLNSWITNFNQQKKFSSKNWIHGEVEKLSINVGKDLDFCLASKYHKGNLLSLFDGVSIQDAEILCLQIEKWSPFISEEHINDKFNSYGIKAILNFDHELKAATLICYRFDSFPLVRSKSCKISAKGGQESGMALFQVAALELKNQENAFCLGNMFFPLSQSTVSDDMQTFILSSVLQHMFDCAGGAFNPYILTGHFVGIDTKSESYEDILKGYFEPDETIRHSTLLPKSAYSNLTGTEATNQDFIWYSDESIRLHKVLSPETNLALHAEFSLGKGLFPHKNKVCTQKENGSALMETNNAFCNYPDCTMHMSPWFTAECVAKEQKQVTFPYKDRNRFWPWV